MDAMAGSFDADVVVVGAGIVGLATARALVARDPSRSVLVLEKEPAVARHQTGRNSGVIHSGIYYRPGSNKAELVARGRTLLVDFCNEHAIPYEFCGKVVVATDDDELPRLRRLEGLAQEHGIPTTRLDRAGLRAIEPHAEGLAALHVPAAGIVDYGTVCDRLAVEIAERGGEVRTGAGVEHLRQDGNGVHLETASGRVDAAAVVNCAGLFSDRVARLGGAEPGVHITPFRGEYHELTHDALGLCRHLIYPVPDPAFPFLGVHFTRSIHGGVHAGPNAVLALAREGYSWRDVSARDLAEMASDPGLWRLARRHWRTGIGEMWRSVSTDALVRALRRLVPEIGPEHLEPAPAGVRAQALRSDGSLLDDFEFHRDGRVLSVINAPSPAATASLAIGERIVQRLAEPA